MEINEEKRQKFMEYAGKRVNNVLHDIQILEPMSRSTSYDFTKQDVEEMFSAMQESLNNAKAEFDKKFEEKARCEKKTFTFGGNSAASVLNTAVPQIETTEASSLNSAVPQVETSTFSETPQAEEITANNITEAENDLSATINDMF